MDTENTKQNVKAEDDSLSTQETQENSEDLKNQDSCTQEQKSTENVSEQTDESQTNESQTDENQNSETKSENPPQENQESADSKIEELEKKIEDLTAQNADLKDQVLRRAADFDNYRKRVLQEKKEMLDYGNSSLLKDLLESLDNFDRTIEAAESAKDPKVIADGIKMINKSMVSMLENKYNLVSYGEVGEAFDPNIHEAIGMQEGDVPNEQLAAVYLKGYKLKDRVIRHAKVMVVKPKAKTQA